MNRLFHAGELHTLVNNVGINIRKPTLEYTVVDVQTLLSVNLASAFHLSQLCFPLLQATGNASVLFVSSVAGGPLAMKSGCIYAMTKGTPTLLRSLHTCTGWVFDTFVLSFGDGHDVLVAHVFWQ